jgi:hypothetical protein
MHRAFSDQNLDRYRRLASGMLTVSERKVILDYLARDCADFRVPACVRRATTH